MQFVENKFYEPWNNRTFLLPEQYSGPEGADEHKRMRLTLKAAGLDGMIRKAFEESPATFMMAQTSRKYTNYETDSASLALIVRKLINEIWAPSFLLLREPYGGQTNWIVASSRIAEFNYTLTKVDAK